MNRSVLQGIADLLRKIARQATREGRDQARLERVRRHLLHALILGLVRESREPVDMYWVYRGVRSRILEYEPNEVADAVNGLVDKGVLHKQGDRVTMTDTETA